MKNTSSRVCVAGTLIFNVLMSMAILIAIQMIARIAFTFKFADVNLFSDNVQHIPLAIANAIRFDAQTAAYAILPIFIIAIVATVINSGKWAFSINRWYTTIIGTLMFILGLADIVFFGNFAEHFNIVTFDLLDEEPILIIKGVWNDTPIIKIALAMVIVGWLISIVYKHITLNSIKNKSRQIAAIAVGLIIIPIAIRGNLGTFPLRAEDIYVSPSSTLNACVPNATFMMKKAWSEKKQQFALQNDADILADNGFSSKDEAIAEWLNIPNDSAQNIAIADALYDITSDAPKAPKMNIIIILTESWSNRLIDYEALYDMDLLGEMRKHLNEDILFRHFLSATNGTIDAVEHITISAAYPHMFTSAYRNISYPTSTAKLFKENGYDTYFVSGIEISWRNLIDVLPKQSFDHVYGKYEMLDEYPNVECNQTWGVYDGDMLKTVNKMLEEPSDKPKFMLCLTSTSHTPFEFPDGYEFGRIDLDNTPDDAFAADNASTTAYLHGYQYESNELGRFMTRLKNSPAAQNTIVAITGDHNIRLILPNDEKNRYMRYSVPLYIYIPKNIDVRADTSRMGSHSDIVPTLANLTLSNAKYFKAGQDLLADSLSQTIAINTEYVLSTLPDSLAQRKANALKALKQLYFSEIFREHK